MIKKLIFGILISISFSQVQIGYVYDSCTQHNNLNFTESSGGTIYFSKYDRNKSFTDHGLMNYSNIFDCLIVLKGKSQGLFQYKRFFGIHFRLWEFDTNSNSRYDVNLTELYNPNILTNIKTKCGDSCKTGCMQLIHPERQTTVNFCGSNQLTGTDYTEYFEQNFLMLRFYLLGGFYTIDPNTTNVSAVIIRPTTNFIIDFFSFYFGKCVDLTTEFQCIYTDRCIDINLKCDIYGGMDCGIVSGGNSISYDQSICSQSSTTASSPTINSIYLLFILFCLPFIILLLLFLCYRPGYCCWRCARLRNCSPISKSHCAKRCTYSCVMGNAPNFCQCCKSALKLAQVPVSSNACICCCGSISNIKHNLSTNKIMPYNFNDVYVENENTLGDGYHLRECR